MVSRNIRVFSVFIFTFYISSVYAQSQENVKAEFPKGPVAMYQYINEYLQPHLSKFQKDGQDLAPLIIISFTVEADGSLTNIKLKKEGANLQQNQLCLELVSSMPKWIPEHVNHTPIKVNKLLPLRFEVN